MSIYTFTLNPALDLSGTVRKIVPNEKNYVLNELRFPGGNGINAARTIHKLGFPVIASGFLGGGIGNEIRHLLTLEGIKHQFIEIKDDTRINVTVSILKSHLQTRLSFPGPQVKKNEIRLLLNFISKIKPPALLLIGGSRPHGFSTLNLAHIIRFCETHGIYIIVDSPSNVLKEVLEKKLLLIKPNLSEFQELVHKKIHSIESVIAEAKKLTNKIQFICVSSVEDGAVLVSSQGVWFGKIPKVKVKSTVGAGDSMVGAMVSFLWKSKIQSMNSAQIENFKHTSSSEMLKWGLAAACATLVRPGTAQGEAKDIRKFYEQISVRILS